MNRLILFVVFVLACLTSACTIRKEPNDDADVLAAVVKQMCPQDNHSYYVLSSMTATVWSSAARRIDDETARQSLIQRNKVATRLPVTESCAGLKLVESAEINSYLEANPRPAGYDGWAAFYSRFEGSGGLFMLSLPGYSEKRDMAVVQIASACGETCGDGTFWILRKTSGHWQFEKAVHGWIS
jgi:hypothetical protein